MKRLFTNELIGEMVKLNEPEAVNRIKRKIALDELAKKANITVSDETVAARAAEILADLNRNDIDVERLREVLKDEMVTKEALKWVLANSTIEMVPEGTLAAAPDLDSDDDDAEAEAVVAEVI